MFSLRATSLEEVANSLVTHAQQPCQSGRANLSAQQPLLCCRANQRDHGLSLPGMAQLLSMCKRKDSKAESNDAQEEHDVDMEIAQRL